MIDFLLGFSAPSAFLFIPEPRSRSNMNVQSSVALLEKTHRFPGPYMFKVIGKDANGFVARVVAAVRDELAAEVDPPFQFRHTAAGRHVAVTLEPVVRSGYQVLAIYHRLRQTTGLVMCW
jgi:putative lipoic acid-binding regulatory protein